MFDSFTPFQQLEIQDFNFVPSRYEVWQGGKKIDYGPTTGSFMAKKSFGSGSPKMKLSFNDSSLFDQLSSENEFDLFLTSTDRLQFVKIPESGNGDYCMGIKMFQMNIGPTRDVYNFQRNEPYCCNLFLQQGRLVKITFSYSTPEKLIEFYLN